jgi:hypothetical protein
VEDRNEPRDLEIPRRLSRWALWGCITLGLAVLLLGMGFALAVLNTSSGRERWRWMQDLDACRQNLQEIAGALDRAHRDKGHLPKRLEDVYPTYLQFPRYLRCPLDARRDHGTTYRYDPSAGWGAGDRVVVWCPMHPPAPQWNPLIRRWTPPAVPAVLSNGSVVLLREPPPAPAPEPLPPSR